MAGAGIVAVVLLLVHGLAWRWATNLLTERFTDWTTTRRAEGWVVEHELPTRGGWPFAARLSVPGLRLAGPPGSGAEAVQAEVPLLVLEVGPPRLDRLRVRLPGEQRLRLGAADYRVAAARLEATVALEPGMPPRAVGLSAEGLRVDTPEGPFGAARAVLTLAARRSAPDADPPVMLDAEAEEVSLPPAPASPAVAAFGRRIRAARLGATLHGPWPPPGAVAAYGPAAVAAGWRDAGGSLDLRELVLRWGPLDGEGQLRLTLDRALQPAGAGVLRLNDAPAALEALALAGVITRGAARTAQGVATLLGRVPDGGGVPQVELPLAIANGTLMLARIPLVRLAPLRWPEAGSVPMR